MFPAPQPPKLVFTTVLLLLLSVLPHALSQTQGAPDNSANNRSQNQSQTADQQKDNAADRTMTAKIRRAIVSDHSLSTYGHNVKVIVSGGTVTLKGPVHSEAEKQSIVAKAGAIAGQDKVTDRLTVKQ
jgi:osmotically-inducible protein OsmY